MIPLLTSLLSTTEAVRAYLDALQRSGFEGDLSTGTADRVVMATDNSIYQVAPDAVVRPRTVEDLRRAVRALAAPGCGPVSLRPRGGGTGTGGQSLGDGVMVDLSRHMNRILEIDVDGGWARVEPGVVKDQLNAALKPHGLFFAPELSPSDRATIGGMISTDACGQGSCLYGKTSHHVLELVTVLTDGTAWRSRPLEDDELAAAKARDDLVGEVHRVVDGVRRENADLIAARFPKLNRSLTGYDLAHIRNAQGLFDLNAVICGSEGTLGLIAEAKIRVLPIPRLSVLVVVRYASFDAALRDVEALVGHGAASVETVDDTLIGLAKGDNIWSEVEAFFPEAGQAVLGANLVEFVGDEEARVEEAVDRLTAELDGEAKAGRIGHTVARGGGVESVWAMRKKAVGLLGAVEGRARPIPFVEDCAVPPENLADFVAEFRAALDRRGLAYGMVGHVDAGVLHVRPALDLQDRAQQGLVRALTDEVLALAMRYGGLLWGEHGKGIRSEFVPEVFGPLYPCLVAIKRAFDPGDRLNPGKIASATARDLMTVDGVPLRGEADRAIRRGVQDAYDEALHCNGNGACFNYDLDDPMCPSWKATRERRHSPKGRAALVREWLRLLALAGVHPVTEAERLRRAPFWRDAVARLRNSFGAWKGQPDFSHEVMEALGGCLACKSCAGQCPIKVDVPTFRSKVLELYHGRYLRRPRDHLVANLESMLPVAARIPRLFNAVIGSWLGRALLAGVGLVDTPMLSRRDLRGALRARNVSWATPDALSRLDERDRRDSVVLVQDAFTSHYDADLVLAFVDLVIALGLRPWMAPFRPNGKPMHVMGFLGRFRDGAARNAATLSALARSDVPLVGLDPSITLTYRSEYKVLGRDAPRVLLFQEWLASRLDRIPEGRDRGEVDLLPHCTERTTASKSLSDWTRVFEHAGIALRILPAGCCGMAGTYGHEAEHRETSRLIFDGSWGRHVAERRSRLATTGYSCRTQVERFAGRRLPHPVEILRDAVSSVGAAPAG